MSMLVENKIDLLPRAPAAFRDARHRASFVLPAAAHELCHEHGLLMSRTSAKCDGDAHLWGGQTVFEAMMLLVNAIHAVESNFHDRAGTSADASAAAAAKHAHRGGGGGTVQLTDLHNLQGLAAQQPRRCCT